MINLFVSGCLCNIVLVSLFQDLNVVGACALILFDEVVEIAVGLLYFLIFIGAILLLPSVLHFPSEIFDQVLFLFCFDGDHSVYVLAFVVGVYHDVIDFILDQFSCC